MTEDEHKRTMLVAMIIKRAILKSAPVDPRETARWN